MSLRATPLPDAHLTKKLLVFVQPPCNYKQLLKGTSDAVKTLKGGISEFIGMAAETETLEIILHLALLKKARNAF